MRPINSFQHGVIDYLWSVAMPLLPRWLGWNDDATRLCDGVAAVGATQSVMTDYELGVVPVLPMQAHLALDGVIGATLIGASILGDRQPPSVRLTLLGAGVFALLAMSMTDPIPAGRGHRRARRTATRIGLVAGDTAASIAGR